MREISVAETMACSRIRPLLALVPVHSSIEDSDDLQSALFPLTRFLPEVLGEVHREWIDQGLDDVYSALVRKVAEDTVEVIGVCCLLKDQTLVPFRLVLRLDSAEDAVLGLELWLGEASPDGTELHKVPYADSIIHGNMLHVIKRLDTITWAYHVGYGEVLP